MIDTERVPIFDKKHPIRVAYQRAIDLSMGGKPDNDYKQMRYYVLYQLAKASVMKYWSLAVVECGCWMGHSTVLLNQAIRESSDETVLHVFDSFEGMSEFGKHDQSPAFPTKESQEHQRKKHRSSVDVLRKLLPEPDTVFHKGWIPDVFATAEVGPIAFANIDLNLYEPTRASLQFVWHRLAHGGIIFLDDYGYSSQPGTTKAVDEFVSGISPQLFMALPFGSAFLVK